MSAIFYRGLKFIFEDKMGEHVLLDCGDFWSNKSSLPMHKFPEQDFLTIPDLLNSLCEKQQTISGELAFPTFLLDVLVASNVMRSKNPVKFLEYGSGAGDISWHLAQVLGAFHEESVLVCANNCINYEWENKIGFVDENTMPKLSYLAGDFGELHLEKDYFDAVIINGRIDFDNPYVVIQDALNLAKKDATIYVLTDNTPLLESTFRLFFDSYKEYVICDDMKVIVVDTRCK